MKPKSILSSLALAALLAGCGVEHSPTAQDQAAGARLQDGQALLSFGAPQEGAAKSVAFRKNNRFYSSEVGAAKSATFKTKEGRTVSGDIGVEGGKLCVVERGGGPEDDLIAEFKVPAGALEQTQHITMTVYGDLLSELVVGFQPSGLEFLKSATLELTVGIDRVDVSGETLVIWHIYEDGTAEEAMATAVLKKNGNSLVIQVVVDGFSRYGTRNK